MKYLKTVEDYLDDYFHKLDEAFDNPLPITWSRNGNFIYGNFKIKEKEYLIEAHFIINDFMTFKFKIKKCDDYSTELVNDGSNDYIRVIPTIKEALLYLLDVIKPNGVIFAAMDSSNGRKFVYDRFIVDYIKNNDFYNGFSNFFRGAKIYTIYLKTIEKDIPSETLKFVIENTEDLYH
jgi:hypothetical protein